MNSNPLQFILHISVLSWLIRVESRSKCSYLMYWFIKYWSKLQSLRQEFEMPGVCVNTTHHWVRFFTCFDSHTVGSVLQHWTLNKLTETAFLSLFLLPGMHLWLGLTARVRLLLHADSSSQRSPPASLCLQVPALAGETPMGAKGEIREQPQDRTFLTKKP